MKRPFPPIYLSIYLSRYVSLQSLKVLFTDSTLLFCLFGPCDNCQIFTVLRTLSLLRRSLQFATALCVGRILDVCMNHVSPLISSFHRRCFRRHRRPPKIVDREMSNHVLSVVEEMKMRPKPHSCSSLKYSSRSSDNDNDNDDSKQQLEGSARAHVLFQQTRKTTYYFWLLFFWISCFGGCGLSLAGDGKSP